MLCVGCDDSGDEASANPVAAKPAASATDHVEAGKKLFSEGNYAGAVDEFTTALAQSRRTEPERTNSVEAEVYFQRGDAFLRLGFPDTAVEDFTAVLRLVPTDGAAYDRRGRAHLLLGDQYKALRDATEAIRIQPESASAYQTRGEVYLQRDQFERAVADFEQAVQQDAALSADIGPRLGEAYYGWSQELVEAGDEAAAAEKLAEARRWNANVGTETAVVSLKPVNDSVELTVAKPIVNEEAEEHYRRGLESQQQERHDEALMEFTQAIALREDFADAYLRRGETLLVMGFPDSALEDFSEAINDGATSAEAFRLQASAFLKLDRPYRASESATDSLHLDPASAEAYAIRGEAYLKMDSWDRSIADLEEAMRRDPTLADRLQPLVAEARKGQAAARESQATAKADEVAQASPIVRATP